MLTSFRALGVKQNVLLAVASYDSMTRERCLHQLFQGLSISTSGIGALSMVAFWTHPRTHPKAHPRANLRG